MARLRKIDDEFEARAELARVAAAGGDLAAYARQHGIDGRSLHAWKLNLARGLRRGGRRRSPAPKHENPGAVRLVELVPAGNSLTACAPSGARYALRVEGGVIEFGDDFRADTLRRVLEVLRAC